MGVGNGSVARRWEAVRAALAATELDALYMTAGPNYAWLVGGSPYAGGLPVWLSALVIPREGDAVAVMSGMHADILDLTAVDHVVTYEDGDDVIATLRRGLEAAGLTGAQRMGVEERMGFADVNALAAAAPALELTSAQSLFDDLRAVKDDGEIDLLRRSGAAADAAFEAGRAAFAEGGTVADAGVRMTEVMLAHGANRPLLGGAFRNYGTAPSDGLVDIDIGASFGGYSVDTARSFHIGAPTSELSEQYAVVRAAYDAAEAVVRDGVPAEDVHAACAKVLTEAGYKQSWKIGHGVGLADGHEAPLVQPGNTNALRSNMAFTIDPGFFVGRDLPLHVEETVLVTDSGCERLTSFSLDLIVI